jgi:hypothetical protein
MTLVPSFCNLLKLCRGIAGHIVVALALFTQATLAAADSLAAGKILHAISGNPVIGASVTLQKSGQTIGSAITDTGGVFSIPLNLPPSPRHQTLTLRAAHGNFVPVSVPVQTDRGTPTETIYKLTLLPKELAGCLGETGKKVVVGHIRPPLGETVADLPSRIAEALQFDLLTRLQEKHLNSEVQPIFEACAGAEPKSIMHGGQWARALKAHAFLSGSVNRGQSDFDVSTLVSDAYDLFDGPQRSKNHAVDLNDPSAAQMDPKTHATILVAVAKGYENARLYAECVDTTVVAEGILGASSPMIIAVRASCQAKLRHTGLVPGGGQ